MHPERAAGILIVTVSFLTAASACTDESKDKVASDPVPTERVAASRQARVKYKSGARYANDLAAALNSADRAYQALQLTLSNPPGRASNLSSPVTA